MVCGDALWDGTGYGTRGEARGEEGKHCAAGHRILVAFEKANPRPCCASNLLLGGGAPRRAASRRCGAGPRSERKAGAAKRSGARRLEGCGERLRAPTRCATMARSLT